MSHQTAGRCKIGTWPTWLVHNRQRDFIRLDVVSQDKIESHINLPKLSKWRKFGSRKPSYVDKRNLELNQWLSYIVKIPDLLLMDEFTQFICAPHSLVDIIRTKLSARDKQIVNAYIYHQSLQYLVKIPTELQPCILQFYSKSPFKDAMMQHYKGKDDAISENRIDLYAAEDVDSILAKVIHNAKIVREIDDDMRNVKTRSTEEDIAIVHGYCHYAMRSRDVPEQVIEARKL